MTDEMPLPNSQETAQPQDPQELKIQLLEEELKEAKDKYLRQLAETENMRKRMKKEAQEMSRFALENLIEEILGPIDNLENALQFTAQMSDETRNWASGFQMILNQFFLVLSNHGINAFKAEGTLFDPHLHEAIETEQTTDYPEGMILKEFVKGYKSAERTIRPARVKVAKAPTPTEEQ